MRNGKVWLGGTIPEALESAYDAIYKLVNSADFGKTDFALRLLGEQEHWIVPTYIADGLKWLEEQLCREASPSSLKAEA